VSLLRRWSLLISVVGLAVSAAAQAGKVNSVLDMMEFVHDWEISKQFTFDVANAMPADQ